MSPERSVTYVSGTDREILVGERGFEPPTPWSRTRCSTRLSHSPTTNEFALARELRRGKNVSLCACAYAPIIAGVDSRCGAHSQSSYFARASPPRVIVVTVGFPAMREGHK